MSHYLGTYTIELKNDLSDREFERLRKRRDVIITSIYIKVIDGAMNNAGATPVFYDKNGRVRDTKPLEIDLANVTRVLDKNNKPIWPDPKRAAE
jgi:hypothetical protein